MPVHVVRVPPGVLQALPKKPRLANSPNLVPSRDDAFFAILPNQLAQRMHQLRLQFLKPLIVRSKLKRMSSASILLARRVIEQVRVGIVATRTTRWQRCWRYRSRRVPIRRRNRARRSGPSLSCRIEIHSRSLNRLHLVCGSQTRPVRVLGRLNRAALFFTSFRCFLLPLLSTPESGSPSVCPTAAPLAVSPPRDTRREEIPPFRAANSSARDSPPAIAPLLLPTVGHNPTARVA